MASNGRSDLRHAWWLIAATLIGGVSTFTACGQDASTDPTDGDGGPTILAGDPGASSSSGAASGSSSSGASSSGGDGGSSSGNVPGATEPNLKVAFIGDTAAGADFKSVLQLIKREKAAFVMIQGDLTYSTSGTAAATWFTAADGELDDGTTKIPYFVSRGNHDDDWTSLGGGLEDRYTKWGAAPDHNEPANNNYSILYKGLRMVFVHESETSNPTRADYVKARLANDPQIWKICSWHKNQRNSNVGPKGNEMGWQIYENCREKGAIVAQGHSHTYSRSKTLTADATQTLDTTCNDPFALCIGPGKHFFFDSSVGGVDLRDLENTNLPHWASTFASDFGALFIEFFVDGDPKKAKGYFKTVGDVVIDPPASSGKTFFTITAQP